MQQRRTFAEPVLRTSRKKKPTANYTYKPRVADVATALAGTFQKGQKRHLCASCKKMKTRLGAQALHHTRIKDPQPHCADIQSTSNLEQSELIIPLTSLGLSGELSRFWGGIPWLEHEHCCPRACPNLAETCLLGSNKLIRDAFDCQISLASPESARCTSDPRHLHTWQVSFENGCIPFE